MIDKTKRKVYVYKPKTNKASTTYTIINTNKLAICVYVSNKKYNGYYSISFTTASQQFAEGLKNKLQSLGYSPTVVLDNRRKDLEFKTYFIKLNKQKEVKSFMDNVYKNSFGFYISYKHDKYYNKNIV